MIVKVKNNTQNLITINDLGGIVIPLSEYIDLTDIFKFYVIASSIELKTNVANEYLTVNNGINDLNIENGLKHIELKSVYDTIIEVQNNSHNIDDHIDVPDKPITGRHMLQQTEDSTSLIWFNYENIAFRSLTFRADPTYNGTMNLLGWYIKINEDSEVNESLASGTTYNSFYEAFHSHIVLNIVSAVGTPFTIRITGTSVDESTGDYTVDDNEDLSIIATGYYQSSKSWINKVDLDIVESSKSCDFDIYRTTYWNKGNVNFTIKGCRLEWTPDQNDWKLNVIIYHYKDDGSLDIIDNIDLQDEDTPLRALDDVPGKYKRGDYNLTISAANQSGIVIWVDQRGIGNFFLEVKYE